MFIFQLILGIIIVLFEFRRKKAMFIDLMTICNLVFFICYVIAPISGYYMYENFNSYSVMRYTYKGILYGQLSYYVTGLCVLVGYLLFMLSYSASKSSSTVKVFKHLFANHVSPIRIFIFAIILLIIAILAFGFESLRVGGPLKWMVSNPRLYNAVDSDSVESSSWLADKFIKLSIFSSYLFWGVRLHVKRSPSKNALLISNKGLINFLFILSLVLATAAIIHAGGRFLLFQYFAVFFIARLIILNKRLKILPSLSLVFFGAVVLLYSRTFFKIFIYDDALSLLDDQDNNILEHYYGVINNYTFPFYALNNNINYPDNSYTFFADIFTFPLNFLPSSMRPDLMVDSTSINTYRLMGEYNRFIPSDIFSYGYINFGFLGIAFTSFLFGFIIKKLNYLLYKENPISVILYVSVCFLIGFRIMYFDPYHFFKGSFEVLACFIILINLKKKNKKYEKI